jgi:hypothetical protein
MTVFVALRDAEGSKFQLHDTRVFLSCCCVLLHLTLRRFQSIKGGFMKQAIASRERDEMKCKFRYLRFSRTKLQKFLFAIILHALASAIVK